MNLRELLANALTQVKPGRRRKGYTPVINTRPASKPKALLGAKLTRNEWEWLPYHSPSAWMAEWNTNLEYQKQVREFEESLQPKEPEGSLIGLLAQAKKQVKRGRPRKDRGELIEGPDQTAYGLKLRELERKYPCSKYYWNDGPSDPQEIPWGSADDIARLVDRLI